MGEGGKPPALILPDIRFRSFVDGRDPCLNSEVGTCRV